MSYTNWYHIWKFWYRYSHLCLTMSRNKNPLCYLKCCFAQNYWAGTVWKSHPKPRQGNSVPSRTTKKDDDDSVDILADHFVLVNKKNPPKELLISKAKWLKIDWHLAVWRLFELPLALVAVPCLKLLSTNHYHHQFYS